MDVAFIDAYTRIHRRPPAEHELQRHFRVSPPSVHQMILTLERAGLIRRHPRSIEVLAPPERLPARSRNRVAPLAISPLRWNDAPIKVPSRVTKHRQHD